MLIPIKDRKTENAIDRLLEHLEKQPKPRGPRPKPKPLALTYGIEKALELIRVQLKSMPGASLVQSPPKLAGIDFGAAGMLDHFRRAIMIEQDLAKIGVTANFRDIHHQVDESRFTLPAQPMRAAEDMQGAGDVPEGAPPQMNDRLMPLGMRLRPTHGKPSREEAYFNEYTRTLEKRKEEALRELFGPSRWANGYGHGERGFDEPQISRVELAQIERSLVHHDTTAALAGIVTISIDRAKLDEYVNSRIQKVVANLARNHAFG